MPKKVTQTEILTVNFRKATLNPDGTLGGVEFHNGGEPIYLSNVQAITFAKQILKRLEAA
jgi:hypothetical protein